MNLRARCPHCQQDQPVAAGTDTQAALQCRSCGQDFVPHKHLFVSMQPPDAKPLAKQPVDLPLDAVAQDATATELARASTRPTRRWWWACGLLAATLLLQGVVQQRLWLAAISPWFHSGLQSVCAVAGCEVSAPLMLSEIAVISSGFDQQPTGEFLLSLHLRHERSHEVATPFVELTLTDDFDRALVRKVFSPQQLGLPQALAAGTGAQIAHRLLLDPELQPHVSGFRIELFYP
jgi:hypothetical protein